MHCMVAVWLVYFLFCGTGQMFIVDNESWFAQATQRFYFIFSPYNTHFVVVVVFCLNIILQIFQLFKREWEQLLDHNKSYKEVT